MANQEKIPAHLASTYKMLRTAYPDYIPDEDYFPLLFILSEEMSERAVGKIIELCGYRSDRIVVCNDVAKSRSVCLPTGDDIQRVQAKLLEAGYRDWLLE